MHKKIKQYCQKNFSKELALIILTALITAFLTAFFTYTANIQFDKRKNDENKNKIQEIVNAEIIENLDIASKYQTTKNIIASDVELVTFIRDNRFYTDSLRELLSNNFQYLNQDDLYHLATIRDKMNIINKKLDLLEETTKKPIISNKPECNFMYFFPEEKYQVHRFLSDDFNRMFYSIKQLSFFVGNSYENLKDAFDITPGKISTFYFNYNKEYKNVDVNCN